MKAQNSSDIEKLFLRIALNDDEEAFRSLFVEFFPSLCVFAHRFIDSWETCEDIVQDTFFKIWRDRKKMEINTSGRNFLITGVRNLCIDYLRKLKTEMSWMQNEALFAKTPDSEDVYTTVELENMLNKALSQLPENVRTVFEKSRFEGKTYSEIASEQNISVKTVEAHITKALKYLRVALKDYLPLVFLFL
ncbi:MAG: RNA polymerase sigma-70 factor [Tannerella sp.]|nr:RNA polymerase sigma-70 factor [Tannerella sp.]